MKIAVTGGAGFIGRNLVASLVSHGAEVIVIDDLSTGSLENLSNVSCQVEEISLLNFERLQNVLEQVDYVFHLAARGSVPKSVADPEMTWNVNAQGTFNVMQAIRRKRIPVIFSSSSSVYGSNQTLPKNEQMWTSPISPYGASKLAAESIVSSFVHSYDLKAMIFRFFNVFGPWQASDHEYAAVIPKWIHSCIVQEPIRIEGDGSQSRDFTYVEDLVEVLLQTLERRIYLETPVNLAFGHSITLKSLSSLLVGRFPSVKFIESAPRIGDIKHSKNDPRLLNQIFPKIKTHTFKEAISKTIDWYVEAHSRANIGKKNIG